MPEIDILLNDYHTYSSEEDSDYLTKDKEAKDKEAVKADPEKESDYSINKPWPKVIKAKVIHD